MFLPVRLTAPHRTPYVTITLIVLNIAVFIIVFTNPSLIVPGAISVYDAQRRLAIIPVSIIRGENLWTLITAMFVHADILHLAGNMLFLFFFGGPVESAMGYRNYIIFYILSGLAATMFHILFITLIPTEYLLTTYTLNPWVTPVLGASGAISGVLGAYLIYYPRSRITFIYPIWFIPLIFTLPVWLYIMIWFMYQLLMGLVTLIGFISSIAYWAHIGGFLTGIGLAPTFMDHKVKLFLEYMRELRRRLREYSSYYVDEEFY